MWGIRSFMVAGIVAMPSRAAITCAGGDVVDPDYIMPNAAVHV